MPPHERYTPAVQARDRVRELRENARKNGNHLLIASIDLDAGIKQTIPHLDSDEEGNVRFTLSKHTPEQAEKHLEELYQSSLETLELVTLPTYEGSANWTDYYRLLGQVATSRVRHQAELAMIFVDQTAMREEMVNGLPGIHVGILEHALEQYEGIVKEHMPKRQNEPAIYKELLKELAELRGAISEHTLLALLNFAQSPDRYGVMPTLMEDISEKTDLMYYYTTTTEDGEPHAYKLPTQVKTSEEFAYLDAAPENGIMLVLSDYLPEAKKDATRNKASSPQNTSQAGQSAETEDKKHPSLYLAELLVKLHRPEVLTDEEHSHLETAREYLAADMERLIREQPGIELPIRKAIEAPVRSGDIRNVANVLTMGLEALKRASRAA